MTSQPLISELINRHAQPGTVRWIGVRPERKAELVAVDEVAITESGLDGDHRSKPGKRAVTLIQYEHLGVIASLLGVETVSPELLRRNIVVSGINLLGLRNRRFRIGGAVLDGSGICAPCSRMEANLGPGGYSALRGHGGITASMVEEGMVLVGDGVEPLEITA
ncbi:MAG: MOSC domain-containing protein [Hyphomicrobiaceae bacterium]